MVGRLTSYGVSMDKPEMTPLTELPKSYSKVLPRLRNIFVGRENETQQFIKYLSFNNSNVRIVGIFGGPGFGKSTLAIQTSHRLASTNVTIEYYDLSEVSFVPYLLYRILETSTNITEHTVILEELKKWADTIVIDTILLFDGCDILFSGSQKGELQNVIEILVKHSDNIKILLTSRYVVSFFDFKSVTLNELKDKDATTLLKNLTSGTSESTLQKIAVSVGNVPLALQVVGALLETHIMTPEKIVFELSRNPIETLSPNELPINSQIQTSLQLSYNSLDEFTQRCGRYLANFPGSFSEDAAFGVLVYMVNKTYWYAHHFQKLNIFLHWVPKPSACLNTLVHHSLLKFHPTLQRYLFHKLIRDFFLHIQAEKNEFEEKSVFRLGFSIYFVKYWNIFHTSVLNNYDYGPRILAALDLERHNFELLETFLPELGSDISYIQTYIAQAEIFASDNLQSLIDYFQHLRNTASEDYLKNRMNNCKSIMVMLDFHSKVAIKEKGPQKYMEIFVELMLQNSAYQEYLFNTERALKTLKERRHRVMEIYGEYGNTVSNSVDKYYQYILKYSLETGDIDIYFEAFQKMIMLKSEVITLRKQNNEQRKGLIEFGAENYKKAKTHYRQYFKPTLEASDYLYTKVLLYYCYLFSADQDKAMKIVHSLDSNSNHLRVYKLVVNYFNVEQVKVLSMFYAKVRPGTYEHNLITLKLKYFQNIEVLHEEVTLRIMKDVCSSDDDNCC